MRKQINYLVMVFFIAIFLVGCQKDETPLTSDTEAVEQQVKKETQRLQETVDITHIYEYRGNSFKITYTLNEAEGEVLKTSGDENLAAEIFGKEEGPQAMLFEDPSEDTKEIIVRVFDTNAEMEQFLKKERTVPQEAFTTPEEGASETARNCYSWFYNGYANFYFYKHIYYNTEMIGMRRSNTRYSGNHWVGSTYNDQLSSLIINKPYYNRAYVSLKQHSCYGGRTINFYAGPGYTTAGVANLKWYTLSGWWWWRKSWNDQVSSYWVYSW
ncbi:hypothetical protein [Ascidiimonas sp. W6]|uniref:hypothetical protein n=1 Tax=Ascidiimonas meishanensis TaxID=3128903 RepID=UPI0030ED6C29